MTKKYWYSEWRSCEKLLEPMVKKADTLHTEYNKYHDKFTSLRAQGKHPNVDYYRGKLWNLQDQALDNYQSTRTLMRGRGQVAMDKLRALDGDNFQPDGWLMKHDHVRDTFFNGFHPIDLIHAAPANYATENANIVTLNEGPMHFGLFFQDNANAAIQIEGIEELHNNLIFHFSIILFSVSWIFLSIILNLVQSYISNKYPKHSRLINSIFNLLPALILILITFTLLYLMGDII